MIVATRLLLASGPTQQAPFTARIWPSPVVGWSLSTARRLLTILLSPYPMIMLSSTTAALLPLESPTIAST